MESTETTPYLRQDPEGLTLVGEEGILRGDFSALQRRLKPNNLFGEMPVKASKIKKQEGVRPTLWDATAGLGEDSFLLAAAGFEVTMFEYDKTVAALLSDALARGMNDPDIMPVVSHMHLLAEDSISAMQRAKKEGVPPPDVIFLDPMFPERKKSGLVKKKFQLIHYLERPCEKESEMLLAALALMPQKAVVKRPQKGAFLAGKKPSYSLPGKSVRYDVYLPASLKELT